MSISVNIATNRVSGVAPLAVLFDAKATTATTTSQPFHELRYEWDFGDPGAGTWGFGASASASKNAALGPITAHVFETAGTYTVELSVFDGVEVATQTVEITVADWSDATHGDTLCVENIATGTGGPAGADYLTSSDGDAAINTTAGNGSIYKRILFKRGDTFDVSVAANILANGPGIVGAYGSGAKPILNWSGSGDTRVLGFGADFGTGYTDWRFMDLDIDGNDAVTAAGIRCNSTTGSELLVLRVDSHNTHPGFALDNEFNATSPLTNFFYIDCTAKNINTSWGWYLEAYGLALMGCDGKTGGGTHTVRIPIAKQFVMSNNNVTGGAEAAHELKLHAFLWAVTSTAWNPGGTGQYSEYIVVSNNNFISTASQWSVTSGPQDAGEDERVRHMIFERNKLTTTAAGTQTLMKVWCSLTSIRNNLLNTSRGDTGGHHALDIETRGTEPAPDQVWIYNNTFYDANNSGDFGAVTLSATPTNTGVKNNVAWSPNDATGYLLSGTGASGLDASNNSTNTQVRQAGSPFTSATPSANADFHLPSGASYAKSGGTAVDVFDDFFGNIRDWDTPTYDMGFHAFTTGSLPGGGSAIANETGNFAVGLMEAQTNPSTISVW